MASEAGSEQREDNGLSGLEAVGRLAAYERALHAAGGVLRPPVGWLSDKQLSALFAPRQIDLLVRRPFDESACHPQEPSAASS